MVDTQALWCVHIYGPDDLIAVESYQEALAEANRYNTFIVAMDRELNDPIMMAVMAVAEEWPYSKEQHSIALARDANVPVEGE